MGDFSTYVLFSEKSGIHHTGHTDDLQRRLIEHNVGLGHAYKFTRKHAPWKLVHSESFATRSEAMAREKFLKSGQGRDRLKKKQASLLQW
jgi:putative endonuclease